MKKMIALLATSAVFACSYVYMLNEVKQPAEQIPVCKVSLKTEVDRLEAQIAMDMAERKPKLQDTRSLDWSAEDAEILKKIAMAEAEGESTEGKALVMLVVLNRVWDDDFPDTIKEVVFQENQFSTVLEGGRYWTTTPNEDCEAALRLIEQGYDESEGALYFESIKEECWHSNNLEFLFEKGNHKFYK
mgnify:CR=1 FL=1